MGTILNFWNSSRQLESSLVERTARCDSTTFSLSSLREGVEEVSLQSTIPGYRTSQDSHRVLLLPSLQPEATAGTEDRLWLIIGITGESYIYIYLYFTFLFLHIL